MSTHNIRFHEEIRKILCGYPLLSVAMTLTQKPKHTDRYVEGQCEESVLPPSSIKYYLFKTIFIMVRCLNEL